MKLALGTVQFGLKYGVANKSGKLKINEVKKIINLAYENNINTLDTASSYGNAEDILGNIGVDNFHISTKIYPGLDLKNDKQVLLKNINQSLRKLDVTKINTIYFHRTSDLSDYNGKLMYETLVNLKQKKIIKNIGISIYSPNELDLILDKYNIDIVQAPYNLVDRRIENSGWLKELKSRNILIHARSIFLQGILLMKYDDLPIYFKQWNQLWKEWNNWLQLNPTISPLDVALGFVYHNNFIDKVVVGVDSCDQLQEIINSARKTSNLDFPNINSEDENLVSPYNWPK